MKEEDIRPAKIFNEYLELARLDTETYFRGTLTERHNCPACGDIGLPAFIKHGFSYENCPNCNSLFVNPRPVAEAFARYYTESPSSKYWASTFYRETADARRIELWQPKARLIRDLMVRYGAENHAIIDIGGGFGLFAEEMRLLVGKSPVVIEPGPLLADECRAKSLVVIQKFLEDVQSGDLPGGAKVFVSFELFEHLHDPGLFLRVLYDLMSPGDLFIFTTLSGCGLDIQVLWENSKAVTPPHHLNFLNPHAAKILLTKSGLIPLEVSTPGKLDIDILVNNRSLIKDRFWANFIDTASDLDKERWQKTIAESGWSSHMILVSRKP